MRENYLKAFSEVEQIIKLMPESLQNKIPKRFKEIISAEKSQTYIPNIKEPFEECNIMDETKVILAVIYRDFLCSKEERERIKLKDSQKLKEYEEELRKKYNPNDLFESRRNIQSVSKSDTLEENAIIEYKEENFIQKLFEKIKHLFKK